MSRTYFYFIRNERGETLAEYISSTLPPEKGAIMNLRPVTSKYNQVEVIQVKQISLPGHTDVTVTAKPAA